MDYSISKENKNSCSCSISRERKTHALVYTLLLLPFNFIWVGLKTSEKHINTDTYFLLMPVFISWASTLLQRLGLHIRRPRGGSFPMNLETKLINYACKKVRLFSDSACMTLLLGLGSTYLRNRRICTCKCPFLCSLPLIDSILEFIYVQISILLHVLPKNIYSKNK